MKKIWKYVAGFFTIVGGILIAFLSGKGAGRKAEKLGNLKDDIKKSKKSIKKTEKSQKDLKKTLKTKKKALEEIERQRKEFGVNVRDSKTSASDAADFLKKYTKKNK